MTTKPFHTASQRYRLKSDGQKTNKRNIELPLQRAKSEPHRTHHGDSTMLVPLTFSDPMYSFAAEGR